MDTTDTTHTNGIKDNSDRITELEKLQPGYKDKFDENDNKWVEQGDTNASMQQSVETLRADTLVLVNEVKLTTTEEIKQTTTTLREEIKAVDVKVDDNKHACDGNTDYLM